MPREKQAKIYCVDNLRHAEYYQMQECFDNLYAESLANKEFTNLMDIILDRENILLAYRNMKSNSGSNTAGTDKLTIKNIGKLTPEEVVDTVRSIVTGSEHGYRPKPVRRKEIPKPNGKMRPLGIPCIWDRLVQQCIKQVMEPICEAKFSENSYGFRPNRSVEHIIHRTYQLMQRMHLHYVIEFDIKGFFDNVDHSKLIRQLWAMGIHDKQLIYLIKQILKAPIKMPDGEMVFPTKGTPQGGIISPLLANIVLNELDWWVDSQWQNHPTVTKYIHIRNDNGVADHSPGYRAARKTHLKEMHIVRYADDFRIFCRTKKDAQCAMIAVTNWLNERLRLEVSPEKTRIVNVKRNYSEFLGFKIKVHQKSHKHVVASYMSDKAFQRQSQKLLEQAKNIANPRKGRNEHSETMLYNSMVIGLHEYYRVATNINLDCERIYRSVMTVLTNRLRKQQSCRLVRKGRPLTKFEVQKFGNTRMMRYVAKTKEPIYPVGYIQCKNPMARKRTVNPYTPEGRKGLHDNLRINTVLMGQLMMQNPRNQSIAYTDNRISLFSAQWGKCAVTGQEFYCVEDIHCHHKVPKHLGGTDAYANLVLILEPVHRLIHATSEATIQKYLNLLNLSDKQLAKVNQLREQAGCKAL